jgi:hypothetical protein
VCCGGSEKALVVAEQDVDVRLNEQRGGEVNRVECAQEWVR